MPAATMPMAADPTNRRAPRLRAYHRATKIRNDGSVSALCFKSPRAIDMRRATWTIRDEAVTCPKCARILGMPGSEPCQLT